MVSPKSIYLNESALNRIESIKEFFKKFTLTPSDSSIISAALEGYEETLLNKDFVNNPNINEDMINSMIEARVKELMEKKG